MTVGSLNGVDLRNDLVLPEISLCVGIEEPQKGAKKLSYMQVSGHHKGGNG